MKKGTRTVWKIQQFEVDSKGKEQIIKTDLFDTLQEMREFVANIKAEPKPYAMEKKKTYYEQSATCYEC